MPKWVRRVGAIAAAATAGTAAWTTGAQAATPTINLGSAHAAVTLPSGCHANSFTVTGSADGSYHGYLQATCNKKGRFYYVSRSPAGKWALRTTKIDIQIPLATTTDNTGTYYVGVRSNHDLILVRRNGNGSLSKVHVLAKPAHGEGPSGFDAASVTASNGNYWATWASWNCGPCEWIEYGVEQARTMVPSIAPRFVGGDQWYSPLIVARPGKAAQLVACEMDTDHMPDAVSSAIVATPNGKDWKLSQQFTSDDCDRFGGTPTNAVASYLGGHTYFAHDGSPGIYDDRSGTFKPTALTGITGPKAILGITHTRVAFIGTTKSGEAEWLQNSDGTFNAAPTGSLSAAPVPVRTDQLINRSGKLIRLFIQEDTTRHIGGARLLEQVQQ